MINGFRFEVRIEDLNNPNLAPAIPADDSRLFRMTDYLRLIDTHTSGPRYDITPLFADYAALTALAADLAAPFVAEKIDFVAGIDALGFIIGTAVALHLQKGFLPVRKGGKLPVPANTVDFTNYAGEERFLELRTSALKPGSRVLLVDEWIDTGAQVAAAAELIEQQGGVIAGIASINMDFNEQTRLLQERYTCHIVWGKNSEG